MTLLIAMEFNHSILETMNRFHRIIQVRTVVLVGNLALVRKFIIVNIETTSATTIGALAFAVIALGALYWLIGESDKSAGAVQQRSPSQISTRAIMWLVFDLGTSGVKAAVLDSDGKIVRSAVEPYPTHTANGGVVEQEVSDWWRALLAAARVVDGEVTKIALTGQMQDLTLLNERGEPLRPAILYSDMRAQAEAAAIIERVGKERLIALTGNEQSADSLWAKVLWLKRNQPDLLSNAKTLLFSPADYAAYKMTGNAVTDTTTASTTGLMILRGRRWLDRATLEEFGIGEVGSLLPPLAAGGAQVGTQNVVGVGVDSVPDSRLVLSFEIRQRRRVPNPARPGR